ncbi:MAG: type II toxin-antitoxin system VapC family toxin [Proteobacteria bacterium]|nr:type II toxin-antitoxin system VapC family toxin [Pseudomonadota bacterium]MBU1737175.1 type II toxin-antitoxin system VapC family toxin [Pseudomonadota bacterium]
MKYLLDTCVISEIIRLKPSTKVTSWIKNENENNFFISVLTIGELHKGIEKLDESRKKQELHNWVDSDLKERFWTRIIDIDLQTAMTWGKIQGLTEQIGKPMPAIDALIAATGITHHLTVVTRNTSDMMESGVALFNPWG